VGGGFLAVGGVIFGVLEMWWLGHRCGVEAAAKAVGSGLASVRFLFPLSWICLDLSFDFLCWLIESIGVSAYAFPWV
jgi:hypothetical protein